MIKNTAVEKLSLRFLDISKAAIEFYIKDATVRFYHLIMLGVKTHSKIKPEQILLVVEM